MAFVHSPLLKRRRRVSKALLHVTDWFPTLLGLAGANVSQSEGLDGFDVWPTLSEDRPSPRHEILHNIDPLYRPADPPKPHPVPPKPRPASMKPRPAAGKGAFKKGPKGTPHKANRLPKKKTKKTRKTKKKAPPPQRPRKPSRDPRVTKPLPTKHKLKSQLQGGSKALAYPLIRDQNPSRTSRRTPESLNESWARQPPRSKSKANAESQMLGPQTPTTGGYRYQSDAQPGPTPAASQNNTHDAPVTGQLQWEQHIWDTSVQAAIRVGDWKLLTGDPGHGDWVPLQMMSSLPGRWWNWERTYTSFFSSSSKPASQHNIWLFNISADPYERWDVSAQRPDVVRALLERLAFHNRTAVPVFFPPDDPRADPALHGGAWGPWLEEEEGEEGRGVEQEQEKYRGVHKRRERKRKEQFSKLHSYFLNEQLTSSLV